MFGSQKDEKILFIPKTAIKGGKKKKLYFRTLKLNFLLNYSGRKGNIKTKINHQY